MGPAETPSLLVSFLPLIIFTIPFIFLNSAIASRKGKNAFLYTILSIIPLVGLYLSIYLSSLTDKSLRYKIEKILNLLEHH